MTIEEFLKDEGNQARLATVSSWLYWDETERIWVVLSRSYGQRKNRYLYRGADLDRALEYLEGREV